MEQPHKTISTVSNIRLCAGWPSPLLFRPVPFFFIFKKMGQALAQQTCTCSALTMQHWLLHIQCCMTNRKVKIDITQYYFDTSIICWCMDNLNETQKKWIDYALQLQFAFTVCPCKLTYMQLIGKKKGYWLMGLSLCLSLYVLIFIRLDEKVQVLLNTYISPLPSGTVDILISAGRGKVWQTPRLRESLYHWYNFSSVWAC